mgnify:CR=1 FL=1
MKKLLVCIAVLVLGISFNANAQAFSKGYRYHSLGFGGSQFIHLGYYDNYYYYGYNGVYDNSWYSPVTAQFNYQFHNQKLLKEHQPLIEETIKKLEE